jgi:hypothetical protein
VLSGRIETNNEQLLPENVVSIRRRNSIAAYSTTDD